jgi:putative ABC transport system permease protein
MFRYNLKLALSSLRKIPILTSLVVSAISVGIGVSITALTVHYVMSGNLIPHKRDVLFAVRLDSWNPLHPFNEDYPGRAPHQLTFHDAECLISAPGRK